MRILSIRTGDYCMRRMRNLCEMYAKCMRSSKNMLSDGFVSMFGVFSKVIGFASFLYAKYAKVFSCIYVGTFTDHVLFRIFAYIFNTCSYGLFCDLGVSSGCLYAKILNFAYFRILRINQVK